MEPELDFRQSMRPRDWKMEIDQSDRRVKSMLNKDPSFSECVASVKNERIVFIRFMVGCWTFFLVSLLPSLLSPPPPPPSRPLLPPSN